MAMTRRDLPPSEFRRTYMKALVRDIKVTCNVDGAQAREALRVVIPFLEARVAAGESIDLGFMLLKAVDTKPAKFESRFGGKTNVTYMVPASKRWLATIRRGWLRTVMPDWSRF